FGRLVAEAGADDQLEFAGLLVDKADGEVVELEQIVGELDDLGFEQAEAFEGVAALDGLGIEAGEFAAGLVDGIDLAIHFAGAGDLADDDNHGVDTPRPGRDAQLVPAGRAVLFDLDLAGPLAGAELALHRDLADQL